MYAHFMEIGYYMHFFTVFWNKTCKFWCHLGFQYSIWALVSALSNPSSSLTVLFGVDDPVICLLLRSHYESHVFWLLKCLQYNSTSTADGEAGMSWHQPSPKCVDNQLPHQQTTVHEALALFPWGSAMQHGGPSGDRLFPFYLLHFWFQIQHHKLPPPEVLRWYIHRWMCI